MRPASKFFSSAFFPKAGRFSPPTRSTHSSAACARRRCLGFVGAGGLGYEISLSMRLFEFPQVLTLMACFVLLLFW